MSQFSKNRFKLILLIFLHLFVIALFVVLITLKKSCIFQKNEEKPKIVEVSELLKPGTVGEISEKEAEEKGILPLPLQIYNTSGVISKVEVNSLIIQGDGKNFSDKQPRNLTLLLTSSTITFGPGQKTQYQGLEGLKYLKVGDSISISSLENIRGKTQFTVDYINKN